MDIAELRREAQRPVLRRSFRLLALDAADEIERLRAALDLISSEAVFANSIGLPAAVGRLGRIREACASTKVS